MNYIDDPTFLLFQDLMPISSHEISAADFELVNLNNEIVFKLSFDKSQQNSAALHHVKPEDRDKLIR